MTDGIGAPASSSATGGIMLGRDYHFDLTRPGVGLYGGLPFEDARPVLRPLPARSCRCATLPRARRWATPTPGRRPRARASPPYRAATRTACSARLSSRATVFCGGDTPCPVVGRVSMDLITVDITHLDADPAEVRIPRVPTRLDIRPLADTAGTIGYEILTSLGNRYRRRYAGGGGNEGSSRRSGGRSSGFSRLSGASRFTPAQTVSHVGPPALLSERELLQQIWFIGYLSLPVVGLTALFTGGALALNIYAGGARFNAEQFVPNIVVLGITRELGPRARGLMLSGRVPPPSPPRSARCG